ncbi:MAG: hypothetical protein KDD62_15600, partial [Bdellovibrionales bacterium]|nr:hypothetical protein [Bdellovibrionales bacterium]
ANQVMKNLAAVLDFIHADFSHVVKTGIFLQSMDDFQTVNEIYAQWMGEVRPARATVAVAGLPKGVLVEIEMVAALDIAVQAMLTHGEGDLLGSSSGGGYALKSDD